MGVRADVGITLALTIARYWVARRVDDSEEFIGEDRRSQRSPDRVCGAGRQRYWRVYGERCGARYEIGGPADLTNRCYAEILDE